jgi:hypothetical protein
MSTQHQNITSKADQNIIEKPAEPGMPQHGPELRELLRSLVHNLSSEHEGIRKTAISRLRDLELAAKPALQAIVRAVADPYEFVAYNAFRLLEQLCPELQHQYPEIWSRLLQGDHQVSLAATEELVRILPSLLPDEGLASEERSEPITEDSMSNPPEPSQSVIPPEVRGKWLAWDAAREKILAVADTYPEIAELVAQADRPDLAPTAFSGPK